MINGAVFDMDGLMIDSERVVYENWQRIMDENGYDYDVEVFKQTVGRRKLEVEQFYYQKYGRDFPYPEFSNLCRERYVNRVKTEGIPLKKGLIELLDSLKSKGIKLAVATSTSRATTDINLSKTGLNRYFDALVCGEDVKNGKPDPEVFLTASQRLGLAPEECVAFEDSINGIKSAYSAKMTTVMVPDMVMPTDEVKPMISYLLNSLDEAIEILNVRC